MGPLAILSVAGVVWPLLGGALEAGVAIERGRTEVGIVGQIEAYRHANMTAKQRRAFAIYFANRLPGRSKLMAAALASAKTQWQRDVTIGIIEMEMFR